MGFSDISRVVIYTIDSVQLRSVLMEWTVCFFIFTDVPCALTLSIRFRTPADRLLKMSLVPSRRLVKRDVSYEFMNRQMVWHAFTVRSFLLVFGVLFLICR